MAMLVAVVVIAVGPMHMRNVAVVAVVVIAIGAVHMRLVIMLCGGGGFCGAHVAVVPAGSVEAWNVQV